MKTTHPAGDAEKAPKSDLGISSDSSAPKPRAALAAIFLASLAGSIATAWWLGRSEASRNNSGTMSLVAGNPVATGTTISSTWANSTLSDIASELTNSLDRNGRGAMAAPLQLTAGTVSLPALTWGAENNSGLYRNASHDIRMSVNGGDLHKWTTSGSEAIANALFDAEAVVDGTGGNAGTMTKTLRFGQASGGEAIGSKRTSGGNQFGLDFYTNSTVRMQLDNANGYLALKQSNPASTTSFTNTLTPTNLTKAWVQVSTNGTPSVSAGFNVSSISCSTKTVTINFAHSFSGSAYGFTCASGSSGSTSVSVYAVITAASNAQISAFGPTTGSQVDLCANNTLNSFSCSFIGAQ